MGTRSIRGITRTLCVVLFSLWAEATAHGQDAYVSPAGTHQSPYATWETAGTNVQAVVEVAVPGSTIWVTNGTYRLAQPVTVTNELVLRSVNGPSVTILDGEDSTRCVRLSHPRAVLDGFTVSHGRVWDWGGGVLCEGGATVRDCVVRDSSAPDGGGIACVSGRVERCYIIDNLALNGASGGGGIYCASGAWVEDCWIVSNRTSAAGGGVYCFDGGIVIRCVIEGNEAWEGGGVSAFDQGTDLDTGRFHGCLIAGNYSERRGGGVYFKFHGTLENCTVTGNRARGFGGGVTSHHSCWIINSIIYDNTLDPGATSTEVNHSIQFFADILNSCSVPQLPFSTDSFTNAPGFVDAVTGDYRLGPASPCIDTGLDITPFHGATSDRWGRPRPLDGNADGIATWDVGAHEFLHPQADTDLDGQLDVEEWIAGTGLRDDQDLFRIHQVSPGGGNTLSASWQSVTGRLYSVQAVHGGEWTDVPGAADLPGTGVPMTHPHAADGTAATLRVNVRLAPHP